MSAWQERMHNTNDTIGGADCIACCDISSRRGLWHSQGRWDLGARRAGSPLLFSGGHSGDRLGDGITSPWVASALST